MNVHTTEPISPRLLANIKSAVELYATFGSENSTVGSLIEVKCQVIYATGHLIVRYKFGDVEIAHATTVDNVLRLRFIDSYLTDLYGLARAFVNDIIDMYAILPDPEFAMALWEVGIGIGGEW